MNNIYKKVFIGLFVVLAMVSCARLETTSKATKTAELDMDEYSTDDEMTEATAPMDKKVKSTKKYKLRTKSYKKQNKSALKAGFADDNKQFNYFLNFLQKYENNTTRVQTNIKDRVVLTVKDSQGNTIPNATITDTSTGTDSQTYSDGTFLSFVGSRYKVSHQQTTSTIAIDKNSKTHIDIKLDTIYKPKSPMPVDIVFTFDTTGSMSEEIRRLKKTIELIYLNLSSVKTKVDVRFGMVLYKDRRDKYITKIIPLTNDLQHFQTELNKVSASGGGDTPEDLVSALRDTTTQMRWRQDGLKLVFVITDAPPHTDYKDAKPYIYYANIAKQKAIKIHTIGTGGLNIDGEYVLRQLSQYTNGKYVFLTYGEKGESDGGAVGSVSHHTGANFTTDKLEKIVIKFVKEDIANATNSSAIDDDYFEANKIKEETKEQTMSKLFDKAFSQIVDYSSTKLDQNTLSVLPTATTNINKNLKLNAEYFGEQLLLSIKKSKTFKIVERNDIQKILNEHKLQDSGLLDETKVIKFGKLVGAEFLLMSKIYIKKDKYEIYIKLVKVSTAEVVSATKIYIDKDLGI